MCLDKTDRRIQYARRGIGYKVFQHGCNGLDVGRGLRGLYRSCYEYETDKWISFAKGGTIGRLYNRLTEWIQGNSPGFYFYFNKEDAIHRAGTAYVVHRIEYKGLFQTGGYSCHDWDSMLHLRPAGHASQIKILERVTDENQTNDSCARFMDNVYSNKPVCALGG